MCEVARLGRVTRAVLRLRGYLLFYPSWQRPGDIPPHIQWHHTQLYETHLTLCGMRMIAPGTLWSRLLGRDLQCTHTHTHTHYNKTCVYRTVWRQIRSWTRPTAESEQGGSTGSLDGIYSSRINKGSVRGGNPSMVEPTPSPRWGKVAQYTRSNQRVTEVTTGTVHVNSLTHH